VFRVSSQVRAADWSSIPYDEDMIRSSLVRHLAKLLIARRAKLVIHDVTFIIIFDSLHYMSAKISPSAVPATV